MYSVDYQWRGNGVRCFTCIEKILLNGIGRNKANHSGTLFSFCKQVKIKELGGVKEDHNIGTFFSL